MQPSTRRLATTFQRLREQGRTGLIPYITAGAPSLTATGYVLEALVQAGADVIELGVPFSDPMADGPVIAQAMSQALGAGATLSRTLDLVRAFRQRDDETPLVLFGYLNPLYRNGLDRACRDAAEAGVDALLVVDLPPEEAEEVAAPCAAHGLDRVALYTPTTDRQRAATIAATASGFAYYVSMAGVTGGQIAPAQAGSSGVVEGQLTEVPATSPDPATAPPRSPAGLGPVAAGVEMVREVTGLPVAVGFGIRTPRDAARVARFADAVVVGTALVRAMAAVPEIDAPRAARDFLRPFREVLDGGGRARSRDERELLASATAYELSDDAEETTDP